MSQLPLDTHRIHTIRPEALCPSDRSLSDRHSVCPILRAGARSAKCGAQVCHVAARKCELSSRSKRATVGCASKLLFVYRSSVASSPWSGGIWIISMEIGSGQIGLRSQEAQGPT